MSPVFEYPHKQKNGLTQLEVCIRFLEEVGIPVSYAELDEPGFLPGLAIQSGGIIIDKIKLLYPGDIIHEAGHIAVVPAAERESLNGFYIEKRPHREAEEMMSICWSYAACIYLDLPLNYVFHTEGYRGGAENMIANFQDKKYIGLPMLQWIGLTADDKQAALSQIAPYPAMIKWLRD